MSLIFVAIAVHEHVLFATVSVKVTEKEQVALLLHLLDQLLVVVDGWVKFRIGLDPDTVKIAAGEGASCVTVNDSVGVDHRHNLHHKVVSKHPRSQAGPH